MNSVNLDNFADPFFLGETKEELRRIRQDFHIHPEIGLITPRTSRIIADLLRKYGVDEVHEGIGGDGVVGVIYGRLPGEASVGLRADIDALPLKELSDHDHVSQVEGAMHACGHDGHAAALLGAAKKLACERNFGGKVVLVFQPGEEGWSGAKHMMEDGLFERFPMQEIYALHNSSAIEPGRIALNYGAMQAAADAFTIVVKGKGGHASRPNLNHDPCDCSRTTLSWHSKRLCLEKLIRWRLRWFRAALFRQATLVRRAFVLIPVKLSVPPVLSLQMLGI